MKIFAPRENDLSQLFACVMDSFRLFGLEFSLLIRSKLEPIYGETWIVDLSKERNTKITLEDTSFLLKEILRNPNSPLRLCIPRYREIFDQIEQVLIERNKWFHNEINIDVRNAIQAVSIINELAHSIPLELKTDLSELLVLLEKIESGQIVDSKSSDDLKEKIDSSQISLRALQLESNEIQNKLSKTEERVQQLQSELIESNQNIDHKDTLLQIITTEKEMLRIQISELKESLNLIEIEKKALENLMLNFEKIQISKEKNSELENINLEMGDTWPFQKGLHKLTLSARFKDIYLSDSSTFLSDLLGSPAKGMAQSWLLLKPNGGPIWLDDHGNMTTYLGEKLCFLGKISTQDLSKIFL